MKTLLILVGVVAVWYILNRWILPRFGVETWLSGACDLPVREVEESKEETEEKNS